MKFKKSEENNYSNMCDITRFYHAQSMNSEENCYALDNALPDTFFDLLGSMPNSKSGFLGYPLLQQIAQNPLISAGVETLADEMTKKFVELSYTSEIKKNEVGISNSNKLIEFIRIDLKKFDIQNLLRKAAEMIGYYGGCLIYIDTGTPENLLNSPLILDSVTFPKNSLKRFHIIDPINCSPGRYNSINPLSKDYFMPSTWLVSGKEIHASRFLYFSGKDAPLLYKPSYNFFGIPLAQLAWEYVMHFTKSRDAAARLLTKFSLTALKTNMSGALAGEGTSSLEARLSYFVEKQNNNGIFALDKEQEELVKLDTSLSGTTEIVRQSLEMIATVFRIPAVKLLGISPSGFNATGQSDIHNFYDYCTSMQEKQLSSNLKKIIELLQINSFSMIDNNLSFKWVALADNEIRNETEINQIKSNILVNYVDKNILTKEEARNYLMQDLNFGTLKV